MFIDIFYKDKKKSEKITVRDFVQNNYKKEDKISLELEYFYYYLFEILDCWEFWEFNDINQKWERVKMWACWVLERLIDIYFQSHNHDLVYLESLILKDKATVENIIEEGSLFADLETSYIVVKLKKYWFIKFNKLKFYKYFGLPTNFSLNLQNFINHINVKHK